MFLSNFRVVVLLPAMASLLGAATCQSDATTSPDGGSAGTSDANENACLDLPLSVQFGIGTSIDTAAPANCSEPNHPYGSCYQIDIGYSSRGGAMPSHGHMQFAIKVELSQICAGCAIVNSFGVSVSSTGADGLIGTVTEDIPWTIRDGQKFWPDGDYDVEISDGSFFLDQSVQCQDLLVDSYMATYDTSAPGWPTFGKIESPLCGPTGHSSGPGSLIANGSFGSLPAPIWKYNDSKNGYLTDCPGQQ
jgi:hypothetical protein